jgi:hypothetical protein
MTSLAVVTSAANPIVELIGADRPGAPCFAGRPSATMMDLPCPTATLTGLFVSARVFSKKNRWAKWRAKLRHRVAI